MKTLDEMVDSIDTKIEDKEEEIENAKEKQRKEELRKDIKSLERQKKSGWFKITIIEPHDVP